jgi:hypothetical protein
MVPFPQEGSTSHDPDQAVDSAQVGPLPLLCHVLAIARGEYEPPVYLVSNKVQVIDLFLFRFLIAGQILGQPTTIFLDLSRVDFIQDIFVERNLLGIHLFDLFHFLGISQNFPGDGLVCGCVFSQIGNIQVRHEKAFE